MRQKGHLWCALLLTLFVAGVLLFGLISVSVAPPYSSYDPCAEGKENADFSCTDGKGVDVYDVPDGQDEDAYRTDNDTFSDEALADYGALGVVWRGISLSGGECIDGDECRNGVYMPVDNDAEFFLYKGMDIVRIPVLMEHFFASSNENYLKRLDALIMRLNCTTIIDMHIIRAVQFLPDAVSKGWKVLASRYINATNVIYSILYVDWASYDVDRYWETIPNLIACVNSAVTAIRAIEGSGFKHMLLLPYVDLFAENATATNDWVLKYNDIPGIHFKDTGDRHMVAASSYFNRDGIYNFRQGECLSLAEYKTKFDKGWPGFVKWAKEKNQTIFFSTVGPVAPTKNCQDVLKYFLEKIHAFPDDGNAGVRGWAAWAGGLPALAYNSRVYNTGTNTRATSLAPGFPSRFYMHDPELYSKYLVPIDQPIPPLTDARHYLQFRNNLSVPILFKRGYVPFQFNGSADVAPGAIGYLYSNTNDSSPIPNLQSHYSAAGYAEDFGFSYTVDYPGITGSPHQVKAFGYGNFANRPKLCIQHLQPKNCPIKDNTGAGPRCYVVFQPTPYKQCHF